LIVDYAMKKEKDIAVIAVSGGLDSCVTTAIAKQDFELAFAHFNYGQRTEKRELKAFNDLADFFNVYFNINFCPCKLFI